MAYVVTDADVDALIERYGFGCDPEVCGECGGSGSAPAEDGPGLTGVTLVCLACEGSGVL